MYTCSERNAQSVGVQWGKAPLTADGSYYSSLLCNSKLAASQGWTCPGDFGTSTFKQFRQKGLGGSHPLNLSVTHILRLLMSTHAHLQAFLRHCTEGMLSATLPLSFRLLPEALTFPLSSIAPPWQGVGLCSPLSCQHKCSPSVLFTGRLCFPRPMTGYASFLTRTKTLKSDI